MRVIHVSKVTGIAGSEGHLLRLLPGLTQHGVEIHMLILEDPRSSAVPFRQELETRGVSAEILPISRWHVDPLLPGRLMRRLRDLQPDLVHTHLLHADLYGLRAAARARVPYAISSRHNNDAFRHNPLIKWLNRRAMKRTQCVVTISRALARFVYEIEGIDPGKVIPVHYGLESPTPDANARRTARDRLGYADDVPLVGVFGRLVRQKGIDVLLEAFASVSGQHPAARLVVIGDGPLRADLEFQTHKLGLKDVVSFTGWIDNARDLMPACDLIAVPSRWEGFGLVTLEAMGYALPLVASRTSALPEIIVDGETGLLVPPENPSALAEAINTLLSGPERTRSFGRAGYERLATTFSVEKMVQATLDVYNKVVSAPTARMN